MRVKELIEKLEELDPEKDVEVYSESYYDNSYLGSVTIVSDRKGAVVILMEPDSGEEEKLRREKKEREQPFRYDEAPKDWGFAVLRRIHPALTCHTCKQGLEPRDEYLYHYSPDIVVHNKKECYASFIH